MMQLRMNAGPESPGGGDVPSMASPAAHAPAEYYDYSQHQHQHQHQYQQHRPDSAGGPGGALPATPGVGAGSVRVSRSQVRPVSLAEVEAARLSAASALGGGGGYGAGGGGALPGGGGPGGGGGGGLGSPDGSKPTSPIASYSGLGFSSY